MAGTLIRRILTVTFTLGSGATFDGSNDTTTVSGLRAQATIDQAGGIAMRHLSLRIYGLTLSTMAKLVTLGKPIAAMARNFVTVEAGDAVNGMSIVFTGTIFQAWIDANGMPDVALVVDANEGQYIAVAPAPPVSYDGPVNVATAMQSLATQAGLAFENNGVNVTLDSPYHFRSVWSQIKGLAEDANINFAVEDSTLVIWPAGGSRDTPTPPLISSATGLVGAPTHTQDGLSIKSVFNPAIRFGKTICLQSQIYGSGTWIVYSLTQDLASETPDGGWFTVAQCVPLGQPVPIPAAGN